MSEVVIYLSNIPRLKEDDPPKQENGRYTLLSLMDAVDTVPQSSMQVLPHTPMAHQQRPAAIPGASNQRPSANPIVLVD